MTEGIDPRLVTGACSMVSWSAWGLHGGAVQFVRLLTIDQHQEWCGLSYRELGDWLNTEARHARRILDALVEQRVLERLAGAGRRASEYRLRDPRQWRGVPWRFPPAKADQFGPPEIVRRRLATLVAPPGPTNSRVVTRYSASLGAVVTRPGSPLQEALRRAGSASQADPQRRAPSASQTAPEPSSREGEPTASITAMDGEKKKKGDIDLTGAAAAVADAIVRTGIGPVRGRLRTQLAETFAGVEAPAVAELLPLLPTGALNGHRPPALVQLACDWWTAGPGPEPSAELAELIELRAKARLDLVEAEIEDDEEVAGIFRDQLARCENAIAQLERRAGLGAHSQPQSQAST